MEYVEKDGQRAVRVQPRVGSVRPATDVKVDGSHLALAVSNGITWHLRVQGNRITGEQKRADGIGQITGRRAPELQRRPPKAWSQPEALFNGKDLTGWEPDRAAMSHWVAQDGVLLNKTKGANLRTIERFKDFHLHFEENCPTGGNSGVYLRGRYELQIENEIRDKPDPLHVMGSIYGVLAPSRMLPQKPGEWETFDVTLLGRYVTVVRDEVTIIDSQEIPGITGGALDSDEAEPGPFYLQGDHTGGMKYRRITVAVPQ